MTSPTQPVSSPTSLTVQDNFINLVLEKSEPLSIKLIERLKRVGVLKGRHWLLICILLTLAAFILANSVLVIGILVQPANSALFEQAIFFHVFGVSMVAVALISTVALFKITQRDLPRIVYCLKAIPDEPAVQAWIQRFSPSKQMTSIVFFGVLVMLLTVSTLFVVGENNVIVAVSVGLMGLMIGMAAGSGAHFFLNFLSITP